MGGGTEQSLPISREELIELDNRMEEESAFKRYYNNKTKIIKRRYG
jgi:hypothetical protein